MNMNHDFTKFNLITKICDDPAFAKKIGIEIIPITTEEGEKNKNGNKKNTIRRTERK